MAGKQTYVFAYDISDDRRRSKIAAVLEDHGMRVQFSVFEARLTGKAARLLADNIKAFMRPPDHLRVYPVAPSTKRDCIVIGGAPVLDDGDFYLL